MTLLKTWRHIFSTIGFSCLVLTALAWLTWPDDRLHIFFLDTSGDAVLIHAPGGKYALIDGGEDPTRLALFLGQHLPFWQRTLDVVILTRADGARLPGQVAALRRYRAMLVLAPPPGTPQRGEQAPPIQNLGDEWARLLQEQRTPVHTARVGDRLHLGDMLLVVIAVEQAGGLPGLVLQVSYGDAQVVVAGASSGTHDAALLPTARPLTALAYPWQREMDTPLMAAWQPHAIIFTSGYQTDHPALLTYAERSRFAGQLYHPHLNGTVELVCTPTRCLVQTER